MPVHCYGQPCEVERIQSIADNYNLKVIYDAAHAFAVECHSGSVLAHGDLSVLSFHATKGSPPSRAARSSVRIEKTKQRIDHLKNFGFVDEVTVVAPGINGKMSEFNAALGLLQLEGIDKALAKRAAVDRRYRAALADLRGHPLPASPPPRCARTMPTSRSWSSPSYPMTRDALYQRFRDQQYLRAPLLLPADQRLSDVSRPAVRDA